MSSTQLPPGRRAAPPSTPAAPPAPRPSLSPGLRAALIWAVVAVGLVLFQFKHAFPGQLVAGDAMDQAQIARNIAAGHGFATSVIRPLAVTGASPFVAVDSHTGTIPDVSYAPLYPTLLGLVFASHHQSAQVVVAVSLFFFLLSIGGVYWLARTLFPGPAQAWIATLSAGLYVLGGTALQYGMAGNAVTLVTLLVTLLLIALFRSHETPRRTAGPGAELFVGVLLGLCYLAQYSLLLLVVPTLAYLFASRAPSRAWRGVALGAAGFLLITFPWLLRSMRLAHGDPFFNLQLFGVMANTSEYPGVSTIYRSVPTVSPLVFFFSHLPEVLTKAVSGLTQYQSELLTTFNLFVLAAAFMSLFWRFGDVRLNALRGYAAVSLLLIVVASVFFVPNVQMLAPFAPGLIVIAVGFVAAVVQQPGWQPLSRRLALWGLGAAVSLGLIGAVLAGPSPTAPVDEGISLLHPSPPLDDTRASEVQKEISQGAILSDDPWEVTWRTGIPTIWLPADNDSYQSLKNTGLPINSILLTPAIAAAYNYAHGEARGWALLQRHLDAWDRYQNDLRLANPEGQMKQVTQQYQILRRLIVAGDPRVPAGMTVAKWDAHYRAEVAAYNRTLGILKARGELGKVIQDNHDGVQRKFQPDYGSISDVLADFTAVVPTMDPNKPVVFMRQSPQGYLSALFLRRDFVERQGQK